MTTIPLVRADAAATTPTDSSPLGDRLDGRRYHPNVDHYRDGGMGGIGEDHSVVGFVSTTTLLAYRHHDGYWDEADPHPHDVEVVTSLRAALASGDGFHTPLTLEYDQHARWAYIGEGNHRLAAAAAEQVPVVPVRVVRSPGAPARRKADGIGSAAHHLPIPGASRGYIPSDIHPSYLVLG